MDTTSEMKNHIVEIVSQNKNGRLCFCVTCFLTAANFARGNSYFCQDCDNVHLFATLLKDLGKRFLTRAQFLMRRVPSLRMRASFDSMNNFVCGFDWNNNDTLSVPCACVFQPASWGDLIRPPSIRTCSEIKIFFWILLWE